MECDKCGQPLEGEVCAHCTSADATKGFHLDPVVVDTEVQIQVEGLRSGEAALMVLRGPQVGEVWTLDADEIGIGRSADSALFLDDVTVSRNHAVLRRREGQWFVEDAGSLNGTYVDHEPISGEVALSSGSELQVGKFKFRFVVGSSA